MASATLFSSGRSASWSSTETLEISWEVLQIVNRNQVSNQATKPEVHILLIRLQLLS